MMKSLKSIVPILLILVGLGVGFFGGFEYRNYRLNQARGGNGNLTGADRAQRFAGNRNGQMGMGMMGRSGVFGSILSIDDKGITVKLADGSSKIVLFTDATTYLNTVKAAKGDLKTGENVAVFGAPNSDGSVTATSIQLNPEFGRPTPTPSSK